MYISSPHTWVCGNEHTHIGAGGDVMEAMERLTKEDLSKLTVAQRTCCATGYASRTALERQRQQRNASTYGDGSGTRTLGSWLGTYGTQWWSFQWRTRYRRLTRPWTLSKKETGEVWYLQMTDCIAGARRLSIDYSVGRRGLGANSGA